MVPCAARAALSSRDLPCHDRHDCRSGCRRGPRCCRASLRTPFLQPATATASPERSFAPSRSSVTRLACDPFACPLFPFALFPARYPSRSSPGALPCLLQRPSRSCGVGAPSAFQEIHGEAPGLQQCGSCQGGLGTNAEETFAADSAAHSHKGRGSHSTDCIAGSLCEPKAIPGVMPGPCLVVHWCLIQLQGGTRLQCCKRRYTKYIPFCAAFLQLLRYLIKLRRWGG